MFTPPAELLQVRNAIFQRQLAIKTMLGSAIWTIHKYGTNDPNEIKFLKKELNEEYAYNSIRLKQIDKEIMSKYEYARLNIANEANRKTA